MDVSNLVTELYYLWYNKRKSLEPITKRKIVRGGDLNLQPWWPRIQPWKILHLVRNSLGTRLRPVSRRNFARESLGTRLTKKQRRAVYCGGWNGSARDWVEDWGREHYSFGLVPNFTVIRITIFLDPGRFSMPTLPSNCMYVARSLQWSNR